MNTSSEKSRDGKPHGTNWLWLRILVLLILVTGIGAACWFWGDSLRLDALADHESQLRRYQQSAPLVFYGLAFAIYVAVTGLSLPGATALTLIYSWFFGFLKGIVLVSFASTTGATVAFLTSRILLRDVLMRRYGDRLKKFNESWSREGPFFLFSLRLIPAVPFFLINLLMGLTPISWSTFWWVSQLGMLPGTAVYVFAGSTVPSLRTLSEKGIAAAFTPGQRAVILAAFVMLAVFPWLARRAVRWVKRWISKHQPRY